MIEVILQGMPSIDVNIEAKVTDSYKQVDSSLSTTSENPVMNKIVTEELNKKAVKEEVTAALNSKADNEEVNAKLTELSAEIGANGATYDSSILTNQGLIDLSGKIYPNESAYSYSDTISLVTGQTVTVTVNQAAIAAVTIYDNNGNYLRSIAGEAYKLSTIEFVVAPNEASVRFCSANNTKVHFSASLSISGIKEEIKQMDEVIQDLSNTDKELKQSIDAFDNDKVYDHYVTLLGSARFGKVTASEKAIAAIFIDGQETLIGKTIVGLKVSIATEGTIVLCRCKGFKKEPFTIETLQSYDVVKGCNYLILDTPITLLDGEAFGVDGSSTAAYHRGGYDSNYNRSFWYYHPTNDHWMQSGADLVMAILTNDIRKEIDTLHDNINSVGQSLQNISRQTLSQIVYPSAPSSLYSHLFINKIYLGSQPTIPSQSVIDVAMAAKLGFKMMEFNVSITSDGVAVTGHPVGNTLQTLTDLNGNAVSVQVSTMTFAELRANYRYKSTHPQFRNPISSLEECLRECQRYDITPLVQCVNQSVIQLTESIVGNRYVAYGAPRTQTIATIYEYLTSGTINDLVARCDVVNPPYILGVSDALLDSWSDVEIKDLLSRVHQKGCWLNWAGCYHTAESNMRMKKLGLDSCASGWEVPHFEEFDIHKDGNSIKGFADFGGTYTTSADGAILSSGQTIFAEIAKLGIVAKGQLSIHFKGSLTIRFGEVNATFDSDGSDITMMNSVIENREAGLSITASADAIIYSLDYKTASVL